MATLLASCSSLVSNNTGKNTQSSSLMDFLYPDQQSRSTYKPEIPVLKLPVTVGIAFVPSKNWQPDGLETQNQVELLEKVKKIATQLELSGNVKTSRKKLRQFVGKAMGLKNKMVENLYIFETSDLAWGNGDLAELDALLRTELEVMTRHQGIQHNIDTVKENLDVFIQILDHKHSSTLEWIIIILIAVEIVQLLIERF